MIICIIHLDYFKLVFLRVCSHLDDGLAGRDVCNGDLLAMVPLTIVGKVYNAFFISTELETNDSFWFVGFEGSKEDLSGWVDDERRSVHGGGIPSGDGKGGSLVDEHANTSELVVIDKTLILGVPGVEKSKITFRHKLLLILSLKSFLFLSINCFHILFYFFVSLYLFFLLK